MSAHFDIAGPTLLSAADRSRLSHVCAADKEAVAQRAVGEVAVLSGFTVAQLTGATRRRSICEARDIACLAAFNAGASYSAIARVLGRDHSTIISAVKRERKRRAPK